MSSKFTTSLHVHSIWNHFPFLEQHLVNTPSQLLLIYDEQLCPSFKAYNKAFDLKQLARTGVIRLVKDRKDKLKLHLSGNFIMNWNCMGDI